MNQAKKLLCLPARLGSLTGYIAAAFRGESISASLAALESALAPDLGKVLLDWGAFVNGLGLFLGCQSDNLGGPFVGIFWKFS